LNNFTNVIVFDIIHKLPRRFHALKNVCAEIQTAALKCHNERFEKYLHSIQVFEMSTSSFHAFFQSFGKAFDSLVNWFLWKAVTDLQCLLVGA